MFPYVLRHSCKRRKFFDTWYYIAICATPCECFSSKLKGTDVILEHILKSKARDQSIQARKKLFDSVIVRNYLYKDFAVK